MAELLGRSGFADASNEIGILTAQVAKLTLALGRAEGDLGQARYQLAWSWQTFGSCACGARRAAPRTHPHALGCPTEIATRSESQAQP